MFAFFSSTAPTDYNCALLVVTLVQWACPSVFHTLRFTIIYCIARRSFRKHVVVLRIHFPLLHQCHHKSGCCCIFTCSHTKSRNCQTPILRVFNELIECIVANERPAWMGARARSMAYCCNICNYDYRCACYGCSMAARPCRNYRQHGEIQPMS